MFKLFKDLSDKKKEITEEDLLELLTDKQTEKDEQKKYEFTSLQVQYGTANIPTATLVVTTKDGEKIQEAATGSGSVEAIYNTLERIVEEPVQLLDYKLNSVGSGRDALANVFVKVLYNGVESSGRGTAQDVLEASARAYINAVNRVCKFESRKVKQKVHL